MVDGLPRACRFGKDLASTMVDGLPSATHSTAVCVCVFLSYYIACGCVCVRLVSGVVGRGVAFGWVSGTDYGGVFVVCRRGTMGSTECSVSAV